MLAAMAYACEIYFTVMTYNNFTTINESKVNKKQILSSITFTTEFKTPD